VYHRCVPKSSSNLWIVDADWYTPIGYGVTWHMVPFTRDESSFPDGITTSIAECYDFIINH
jgi:hypothetical protein